MTTETSNKPRNGRYSVLNFLERIRDSVQVGEDKTVCIFLMAGEVRIRIDFDLGETHLSYTVSKSIDLFSILNESNEDGFFDKFSEEVNGAIAEWEVGEK